MPTYLVIIEKGERNYGAYAPDVPGCVATGKTVEEIQTRMQEALVFHLEGLAKDHEPVPEPLSEAVKITVPEPKTEPRRSRDVREMTSDELWERIRALEGRQIRTLMRGSLNVIVNVTDRYIERKTPRSKVPGKVYKKEIIQGFDLLKRTGELVLSKAGGPGLWSGPWLWSFVPAVLYAALDKDQVERIPGATGIRLKSKRLASAS